MYYCWQVSHIHPIRTLISTICLWVGYETTSSKFSNWAYSIMMAKLCLCFSQLNGIYYLLFSLDFLDLFFHSGLLLNFVANLRNSVGCEMNFPNLSGPIRHSTNFPLDCSISTQSFKRFCGCTLQ